MKKTLPDAMYVFENFARLARKFKESPRPEPKKHPI